MTVTDAPPTPRATPAPPSPEAPSRRWSDRAVRLPWLWAALAALLAMSSVWLARAIAGGDVPDADDGRVAALAVSLQVVLGVAAALALRRAASRHRWLPPLLLIPAVLSPQMLDLMEDALPPDAARFVGRALGALWRWASAYGLGPGVVLFEVWTWAPFVAVVALTGLGAIPSALYEVAEVDRVGRWFRWRHIAWPLVGPVVLVTAAYRATDTLLTLANGQDVRRVLLGYALLVIACAAGSRRRRGDRA